MKKLTLITLAIFNILLVGCASTPQPSLSLSKDFYSNKSQTIGVYMAPLPKTNTSFPGADCLLCMALAEGMNSNLTSHIQSLNTNEQKGLDSAVADILSENSLTPRIIHTPINFDKLDDFDTEQLNFASKDLRPLRSTLGVDKLAFISIY